MTTSKTLALLAIVLTALIGIGCSVSEDKVRKEYSEINLPDSSSPRADLVDLQHLVPSRHVIFETDEGTLLNVDVSPDGKELTFDLLGDLYLLPIDGGEAKSITTGREWDQAPRFSLDGAYIYFLSDRDGYKNIWRVSRTNQSLKQITRSESDIIGSPNWTLDGEQLIAGVGDAYTRNTEVTLYLIDPTTGDMTPVDALSGPWIDMETFKSNRPAIKIFSGTQTSDGQVIFSQVKTDQVKNRLSIHLQKLDLQTHTHTRITPEDASYNEYKPQVSRDGTLIAYFRQYADRRTEVRIFNKLTGQDRTLIELTNADDAAYGSLDDTRPNYAFTPDNQSVVFWHDGKILQVGLMSGHADDIPFRVVVDREVWVRALPIVDHSSDVREAATVRWPNISRDGLILTFAAIGYVWVMEIDTGRIRRLTDSTDFEYMPSLSPDGASVAYTSFTQHDGKYGSGRLVVADIDDGTQSELLAAPEENYLLPRWSQDSQKIAVIRELLGNSGTEASFGWTEATHGAYHEVASAPSSDDRSSYRLHARFVGFDRSGRKLLFSFPMSRKRVVLYSANLDGSGLQSLAYGTPDVGGISPSMDLNRLALTRWDDTVWVIPFDRASRSMTVSASTPHARRISDGGGLYVEWSGAEHLSYGFGQNVYRRNLDRDSLDTFQVRVPLNRPIPTRPIVFHGARLITMANVGGSQSVIESGTIVIHEQRIAAVGPASVVAIPTNATVINATGMTIMPGLLDTHYHRIGGKGFSAFAMPNTEFSDPSAIAYGVTTAWEPGGAVNDGVPATVDLQAAGRIVGPRWSHSAMGTVGYPFELLTNYTAALAAVEQHQQLGVVVLKEYNTPTRQQRQWLSAAAHEKDLGIVSHLQSFEGMMTRVVDGYTGGDHPYVPVPFFKDVHELLRQSGYIWTPNIVISLGSVAGSAGLDSYYWQEILQRSPNEIAKLDKIMPGRTMVSYSDGRASKNYELYRASRVAAQAALAATKGVHIGVSAHNLPGINLHREMWHLWKGGMPIEDVLRAATMGNAMKLGLQDEVGSLEVGKLADFLVLENNPLDDILNTHSLIFTVQGGTIYDSNTAATVDLSKFR